MNQLEQKSAGTVKLNLSVPSDAKVGIYGRKGMPPSHIQFDFFKVIDGIRMGVRSKRAVVGLIYFTCVYLCKLTKYLPTSET